MRQHQRSKGVTHPAVHPAIARLWDEIREQRTSQEDVSERSGVSSSAMRKWRRGDRAANINDLEAALNVLGLRLVVRNIRQEC